MKVQINPERCQGHGRCYDLAPGLFGDDDEGYGTGPRRRHRAAGARSTTRVWPRLNCPEHAIELTEEGLTWPSMTASPATPRSRRRARPLGTRSEIITGPVSDWATDFSHLEPEWAADPYPIQDDLRQRCPIAHTDRFGGGWLPTRYEDVAAIAYDTERFSSRAIIVSNFRPPRELAPIGGVAADLLRPAVPPRRAQAAAARVHQEGDRQAGAGHQGVLPRADRRVRGAGRRRRRRRLRAAHPGAGHRRHARLPPGGRAAVPRVRRGPARGHQPAAGGAHRRGSSGCSTTCSRRSTTTSSNPRDDLTTYLLNAEIYGQKLDPDHVAGTMALLLIAGIDTTWSAIGASLWHLAKTPGRPRSASSAEPELLPTAMEELLRAYAPVTMARLVKEDMHWHGVRHEGRRLDPAVVPGGQPRPGAVRPAPTRSSSTARSTGTPRSASASTAASVRTWRGWSSGSPSKCGSSGSRGSPSHDPAAVTWSAGQIRGPRTLPLRIG